MWTPRRCGAHHDFERALLITNSIVVGNVRGQLSSLFTKLSTLQAKQNFALALVTGNLFAEDDETVADLLAGKITIPLPTYFTVGSTPLPQSIINKIEKDEEVWSLVPDSFRVD